jgi:hypothetical protein
MGLHSNGNLLALIANIRLGWKGPTITDTVAHKGLQKILLYRSLTGIYSKSRHLALPLILDKGGRNKQISLLWFRIHYNHKKFYDTGP